MNKRLIKTIMLSISFLTVCIYAQPLIQYFEEKINVMKSSDDFLKTNNVPMNSEMGKLGYTKIYDHLNGIEIKDTDLERKHTPNIRGNNIVGEFEDITKNFIM